MSKLALRSAYAAAISVVGLIGTEAPATASPFTLMIDSSTEADGALTLTLSGDTSATRGAVQFYELEQAPNFFDNYTATFTDPSATVAISNPHLTFSGGLLTGRVETFSIGSSVSFSAFNDTTGKTIATFSGYTGSFDLVDDYDPAFGFFNYRIENDKLSVLGSSLELSFTTVAVTGDPFASTVPLPASAPMFGAALLALGAVGYGVKRKRAAAAA